MLHALYATSQEYTVVANPGADASSQVRINWHASDSTLTALRYAEACDSVWANVRTLHASPQLVEEFDSMWSKTADNQNFWEYPHFYRYVVQLDSLRSGTEYKYCIGESEIERRFKTAPDAGGEWTAALISDFHVYPPIPGRLRAAMAMLDTLVAVNGEDVDLLLHVGDVTAWGGSYSFWRQLYGQDWISNHLVAGVIGNHDHMTRRLESNGWVGSSDDRCGNQYFRLTNANPENGYGSEIGVCYWFRYSDVLFVMLDNESMHHVEGLDAAQAWVREVVASNPAEKIVVMEHYEWFDGVDGKVSQYEQWHELFDELGVDLAIAGNNHVYARTWPLIGGRPCDNGEGTVYLQTPSCDNGRGQEIGEWTDNTDLLATRWSEGARTVGAMLMRYVDGKFQLSLFNRAGKLVDYFEVQ